MTDFIKNNCTFFTGTKNINTGLINPAVYESEKTKLSIPLVYGDALVKPVKIYENQYSYYKKKATTSIFALCLGEIQGVKGIYPVDDVNIIDDGEIITNKIADATDYRPSSGYPVNPQQTYLKFLYNVEVKNGSKNQTVLTYANSRYKSDPVKPWDSKKKANGVALLSIDRHPVLDFLSKITGKKADFTDIKVLVGGRMVEDFDHPKGSRPLVSSGNAALALFDYLTNKEFGAGYDESLIDIPSFKTVRDYLGVNRYVFGGVVDLTRSIKDNVNEMLKTFNGVLFEHAGKIHLRANKTESVSASFDESNIVGRLRLDHQEAFKKINTVTLKFKSKRQNTDLYMALPDSPDAQLAKDGKVIAKEIKTSLINDFDTAKKLVNFHYRFDRKSRRVAFFDVSTSTYNLKPCDVIEVSEKENQLNNAKFRIDSITRGLGKNFGKTSIIATEYFSSDYIGDIGVTVPNEPDLVPDPAMVFPPSNLAFKLTDPAVTSAGFLVWLKSATQSVSEYEVQYKKSTSATWIEHSIVTVDQAAFSYLDPVTYDFRVRATDVIGYSSDWVELKNVSVSDSITYPKPTGQQLETENADKTVSETSDWFVVWDDVRDNLLPNQSDEKFKGKTFNELFKHFEIKVKSGSTVLHTRKVKTNRFVYSFEQAKADGIRRNLTFEITFVSLSGRKSSAAVLSATNPQQGIPQNIKVKGGISGLFVDFAYPKEKDFRGVKIHAGLEPNFTPNASNLLSDVHNTNHFTKAYSQTDKGTYYLKIGAYDSLGTDNISYSSAYSFKIDDLEVFIDSVSVSDLADEIKEKIAKIDENAADIAENINDIRSVDTKVTTETDNRVSGDIALGNRIDTVVSKSNSNASAIQTEKTTRASADSALGKRVDTVVSTANADRGKVNALSTRVTKTETDVRGKASVSSVNTLQTQVGKHTASIQDNSRSINGVRAQRVIKTDANGVIAGIGLLSDSKTQRSEVAVLANKFFVLGSAKDVQNSSKIPFYVTGGKTYIKEAMIKDASIQSAKIGSLDVGKLTTGTLRTATDILAGSGSNTSGMSGRAGIRFWAGKSDRNTAPFRVSSSGRVDCTNLHVSGNSTFKGDITGASGNFTGTIQAKKIIGDFLRVYQSNAISSVLYTEGSATAPRLNNSVIPVSKNVSDPSGWVTITNNFDTISADNDIDRRYVALTDIGAILYIPSGYNSSYQIRVSLRVQVYDSATRAWHTVQMYEYNSSQVWLMNAVGNKSAYFPNNTYNNILVKPYLGSSQRITKGKSHKLRLTGRVTAQRYDFSRNRTYYLAGVKLLFSNQPDSTCQYGLTKFN